VKHLVPALPYVCVLEGQVLLCIRFWFSFKNKKFDWIEFRAFILILMFMLTLTLKFSLLNGTPLSTFNLIISDTTLLLFSLINVFLTFK
jgi:hypothetical protein